MALVDLNDLVISQVRSAADLVNEVDEEDGRDPDLDRGEHAEQEGGVHGGRAQEADRQPPHWCSSCHRPTPSASAMRAARATTQPATSRK